MLKCRVHLALFILILLGVGTLAQSQILSPPTVPGVVTQPSLPSSPTIPEIQFKPGVPKPITEPFGRMPQGVSKDPVPVSKNPILAPSTFSVFLLTLFSGMTLTATETSKEADFSQARKRQKGFVIIGPATFEDFREREKEEERLRFRANVSPIYGKNQIRNSSGDTPSKVPKPPSNPPANPFSVKKSYEKEPLSNWQKNNPIFASQAALVGVAVQAQLGSTLIPRQLDFQWLQTQDPSKHIAHVFIGNKTAVHLEFDYQFKFGGELPAIRNIEIGTKDIGNGILYFLTQGIKIPKELTSFIPMASTFGKVTLLSTNRVEISKGKSKEAVFTVLHDGEKFSLVSTPGRILSPEEVQFSDRLKRKMEGMKLKLPTVSMPVNVKVVREPEPIAEPKISNAQLTASWVKGFQNAVFELNQYGVSMSYSKAPFLPGTMHVLVNQRHRSWPAVQFDVFVTQQERENLGTKTKVYLANISCGGKDPQKDLIKELFTRAFIPNSMLDPSLIFLQNGPILFLTFKTIYTTVPIAVHGIPGSKESFFRSSTEKLGDFGKEIYGIEFEPMGQDHAHLSILAFKATHEGDGLTYALRDYSRESEATIFLDIRRQKKQVDLAVKMNINPRYASLLLQKHKFVHFFSGLVATMSSKNGDVSIFSTPENILKVEGIEADKPFIERISVAVEEVLKRVKEN